MATGSSKTTKPKVARPSNATKRAGEAVLSFIKAPSRSMSGFRQKAAEYFNHRQQTSAAYMNSLHEDETLMKHFTDKISSKLEHVLEVGIDEKINAATAIRLLTKLIPVEGGIDQLAESINYEQPLRIGGPEMGKVTKKFLVLTFGGHKDTQMKYAERNFRSQNIPIFNSEAEKDWLTSGGDKVCIEGLYSASGEMRQGVWWPTKYYEGVLPNSNILNQRNMSIYGGLMLTQMHLWYHLNEYFLNAADKSWLADQQQASATKYYAINYIEDIITISNGMEYSACDVTVYLCRAKTRTSLPPAGAWFNPRIGIGSSSTSNPGLGMMRKDYVYESTLTSTTLPGSAFSSLDAVEHHAFANTHIGSTPFYASEFRNTWSVEGVYKQRIQPTDKWELSITRKMRHATDVRELYENYLGFDKGGYVEGDYALLVTHRGCPTFMSWVGGPLTPGQQAIREADIGPSKIMINNRSNFGITSPNLFNSKLDSNDQQTNYIYGVGKQLDTSLKTFAFGDAEWSPSVVTSVEYKKGGEKDEL